MIWRPLVLLLCAIAALTTTIGPALIVIGVTGLWAAGGLAVDEARNLRGPHDG